MRTINIILSKLGYTKEELDIICSKCDCCNGCGGKGGVNFEKVMEALPYFNTEKGKKLKEDLHYLCLWHDYMFYKGGNWLDFIKANYIFTLGVYKLLNWTKFIYRILLVIVLFLGLMIRGKKYFNWGRE